MFTEKQSNAVYRMVDTIRSEMREVCRDSVSCETCHGYNKYSKNKCKFEDAASELEAIHDKFSED